jgi:hypothetical protein
LSIGGFEVEKVKLSVEMEPGLRRQVKIAAAGRDQSIREWLLGAIHHELEHEGEEAEELYLSEGGKPRGLREGAPKLGSGNTLSEAVIEDRR